MKELKKKSMRILLGILSLRFIYSLVHMILDIRNEYSNALEMGGVELFIIGGSMVLLWKYSKPPKLGLCCLFFIDFATLLVDFLKYSVLSGAHSNWNLLTKEVLIFDGIPLFLFWSFLLVFLFTWAASDSKAREELGTEEPETSPS